MALENQLTLQLVDREEEVSSTANATLKQPRPSPSPQLAIPDRNGMPPAQPGSSSPDGRVLFALTNRLAPIKIALRAALHLTGTGTWPKLAAFRAAAGDAARALGIQIRSEDQRAARQGADRRWTGFPVSDDAEAALSRFFSSFTFTSLDGIPGPFEVLQLASLENDLVVLTEAGVRLAMAPSPLLQEVNGLTLGDEEQAVFLERFQAAPGERLAISEFVDSVRAASGAQGQVDAALLERHIGWSEAQVVAHRSAMIGRLRDLGLLTVNGRGSSAVIRPSSRLEALDSQRKNG